MSTEYGVLTEYGVWTRAAVQKKYLMYILKYIHTYRQTDRVYIVSPRKMPFGLHNSIQKKPLSTQNRIIHTADRRPQTGPQTACPRCLPHRPGGVGVWVAWVAGAWRMSSMSSKGPRTKSRPDSPSSTSAGFCGSIVRYPDAQPGGPSSAAYRFYVPCTYMCRFCFFSQV